MIWWMAPMNKPDDEGREAESSLDDPAPDDGKETAEIWLDQDVLAHFRATGRGLQSRINAELRKAAGL